jgi:outer membrane protein OmpA-like peptidoglycan-associated protein/tetratricopeptide (TPR) repeat protein
MKKFYNLFFVIVFSFALIVNSFGQNVDFKKENFVGQKKELKQANRNIKKGNACFNEDMKGKYAEALDYYLLANSFNPNNALLNYEIGVCYLKSFYQNNSLIYLENAQRLNANASPELNYYLGRAYQYNYMFDEAIAKYKEYLASLKNFTPDDTANINRRIMECVNGIELIKNSNKVIIENIGGHINSMWDDYSPFVNQDETMMAFTSRRKTTTGGKTNPFDYMYYEDIYFIYKNADGSWSNPFNPGKPLNDNRNNATIDLSPSGDTITIYQNKSFNDFLYESYKVKGKWVKPVKLQKEVNMRTFWQPSATYSKDKKTIYFISDREGGFGGTDIYMSKQMADGKWDIAKNLGQEINTKFGEDAVYLVNDSILYFSSQGHNTMGGYDIFITKLDNGKWTKPVNIGYPMNSAGDDMFLMISQAGNGYFASDRQGGFGGLDDYFVRFNMSADEILSQILPVYIDGSFIDDKSGEPVMGSVNVLDSIQRPYSITFSDSLGKFSTSLTSTKKFFMNINIKGCFNSPMKGLKKFGTLYTPGNSPADQLNGNFKPTVVSGYVIDDKTFQPLQPKIVVIDVKTNKTLATIIPDTNGKFVISLVSSRQYLFSFKTEGCEHKKVYIAEDDINYAVSDINGKQIKLENVYFDFDKYYIRPDAAEILNRHVELFLKNKDWKLILKGHTDNMGSDNYNLFLSKKRSESVRDYLVEKGLKRNRFKMEGYGFTQSAATNTTPKGRQLNRRVEFYIKK